MTKEEQIKQLEERIRELEEANTALRQSLRSAKDPTPVRRVTFERLEALATEAGMGVKRCGEYVDWFKSQTLGRTLKRFKRCGVVISLGGLKRHFKRYKEAFEFLAREDWELSEFTEEPQSEKPKREKGTCKYCHNPIRWLPNLLGKWKPFNHDGSPHYCHEFRESFSTVEAMPMPSG